MGRLHDRRPDVGAHVVARSHRRETEGATINVCRVRVLRALRGAPSMRAPTVTEGGHCHVCHCRSQGFRRYERLPQVA